VLDHLGRGARPVGRALDQAAAQRRVARREEQEPERAPAVAARAPDLLVVDLERAGRPEVHHRAHVGAVDPHAEGVGRDDEVELAAREVPLHGVARGGVEPGVVGRRAPAAPCEPHRLLLRTAAGRRVDDRGPPAGPRRAEGLGQGRAHRGVALAPARHLGRAQRELGAREAAHELRGVGGEAQPRQDLVAHDGSRGGRAGEHARLGMARHELAQRQVLGPEVVAPLADAVRLVDGDERAVEVLEQRAEGGLREPLGRRVDERELAARERGLAAPRLARLERRGEVGRRDAAAPERRDLVLHQRDQRRDDERRAREEARRELVAEALAAARGRDQEEPPLREERLDRLALPGSKAGVLEARERGLEVRRAVFCDHHPPRPRTGRTSLAASEPAARGWLRLRDRLPMYV
jgi:hypothetical protein